MKHLYFIYNKGGIQQALEIIFEERKSLEVNEGKGREYEDHVSVNSESDSEFEEEDEIDHQPAT